MGQNYGGMKNVRVLYLYLGIMLALASPASAQFYDIELMTVCMDSAGVRTNLASAQLYVLGRNGFDVVFQYYFDETGAKVVPGGSVTIYDSPCEDIVTEDTVAVVTFESSFAGGVYTIPEATYDIISIVNAGATTHTIFVNGGAMRLLPGEAYYFYSTFDEFSREQTRNPEIEISQGVASVNNLRVYLEPK